MTFTKIKGTIFSCVVTNPHPWMLALHNGNCIGYEMSAIPLKSMLYVSCSVDCGIPSTPPDMTVHYVTTFFLSTAQYSCAPGHAWDGGAGNFSCLGSGEWDNATLQCIGKKSEPNFTKESYVSRKTKCFRTLLLSHFWHHVAGWSWGIRTTDWAHESLTCIRLLVQ